MAEKDGSDLDAALAALAREASSGPPPDLVSRVMVDAALTVLEREARLVTPRPTPDLVARVLADAAETSATSRQALAPMPSTPGRARRQHWFAGLLLGWRGGALASMALALMIGIGIGMDSERTLPLLDSRGTAADELTVALAGQDVMLVGGL